MIEDTATTSTDADPVLEAFKTRVEEAITSDDPLQIAKAQLEVSWAQMQYLQRIDWKMWELYTKFIR
jgi:hypothetical protein